MIGHRTGDGQRRLDDIEAAHLTARLAAGRELARQAGLLVALAQEVGVQRQDHVGRGGLEARHQRLAESDLRALDGAVVGQRRVTDELRRREALEDPAAQIGEQRRGRRRGQEAEARTLALGHGVRAHGRLRQERPPGEPAGAGAQLLRAIVVVDAQHQALFERGGGAQRLRVVGVALDLGRAPLVALDEQAARVAVEAVRRREVQRVTRRDLFGPAHERDDLLARLAACGADRGHRRRQTRHLHEATARNVLDVVDLGGVDVERPARELVGGADRRTLAITLRGAPPVFRRRRRRGSRRAGDRE